MDLKEWIIYIYDSLAHKTKDMPDMRENAIMSMGCFLPKVMQIVGYFEHAGLPKKMDIFKAVKVPLEFVATQDDGGSCGMFCIAFLDHIVKGIPLNTI